MTAHAEKNQEEEQPLVRLCAKLPRLSLSQIGNVLFGVHLGPIRKGKNSAKTAGRVI